MPGPDDSRVAEGRVGYVVLVHKAGRATSRQHKRRFTTRAAAAAVVITTIGGAVVTPGHAGSIAKPCRTDELQIALGASTAGLGHEGIAIVFRGRGTACTLRGFPNVAGVTARGKVIKRARPLLQGYLFGQGQVTTVIISRGHPASALLEGVYPGLFSHPCRTYRFRQYRFVRISPPGNTRTVRLRLPVIAGAPWAFCAPTIHPVTGGRSGLP